MAIDTRVQTSRRALLLASVGGAAALVAQALGRPLATRATDGDAVEVGGSYQGTTTTQFTTTDQNALGGVSTSAIGVVGTTATATGVSGVADTGIGIEGISNGGPLEPLLTKRLGRLGVRGTRLRTLNATTEGIGVRGESQAGFGVYGVSTVGDFAGVFGRADDVGIGIVGSSPVIGVLGAADEDSGVALYGLGSTEAGYALAVDGKAAFKRSGKATVLKNKRSVDVDLRTNGGLNGFSLCFAVMQTSRSGTWVRNVRPNYPSSGKMRIYLNKVASTTSSSTVAWLVMD